MSILSARLLGHKRLYNFHRRMLRRALQGLGFDNYESFAVSGEQHLLRDVLGGSISVAIDIGANEGEYTAEILKHSPSARVICFEPHPLTAKRLELRFAGNPNVTVEEVAVGNKNGDSHLYDYVESDGTGHASTIEEVISVVHNSRSECHKVRMVALDTLMADSEIDIVDLMKIDVEGLELAVIDGAQQFIDRHQVRFIQFEFGEMNMLSGVHLGKFIDALPKYKLHRMLPSWLAPIGNPFSIENKIYHYQNILAVRNDM